MTEAEAKLRQAERAITDVTKIPITHAQLALAQNRMAASLRVVVVIIASIMALSVLGIWFIYGRSVSAVPQSARFVWSDDQTCVYRTTYDLSNGRRTTIDAEAPDAACPTNPNVQSLWMYPGGPSTPAPGERLR